MQNKCLKILYNFDMRKNTTELYNETQKLNLKSMNYVALCILMYKFINNLIQNDYEILYNVDIHRYNTRQALDFHVDFTRTNIGRMGIITKAVHLYNDLPRSIKDISTLPNFKKQIKMYWFSKQ